MIEQFQNHILNRFSFLQKRKLLIAISGGIDSVVLTHLCHDLHFNTALAHCNFNLRGDESDADEEFVLQLAENLNLEVFIESFDTKIYAKSNKLSIQMAARDLRYHWFKELAEQLNFDYILTAHHADDNLETFLINLSRGTGLDGLTGIPEVNDNLVRPLLSFSREMIETYAKEKNYKWREDSSNSSKKYVRNKLRLDIIPALKDLNPNFLQSFQTTLNNLNDTADIVEESLNAVLKRAIVSIDNSEMQIKVSAFKKLNNPKAYLHEFLKDYGFTEWNDVVNLLYAQSGKQVFSPKYRLLKDRDVLILKEIDSNESDVIISISEADSEVQLPLGAFVLSDVSQIEETNSRIIYVDKETLKFPLTLRKWGQGDYFYPSGMQGKKKLSKYFKDEKLSLIEKENIWLLCSSEDVVWVIGMRTDRRFKVRGSTRNILKIKLV
jgi:tRNA(Ile)-lysidine synthase